ncbi:hypothetical protein [Noviherbaspirillum malthae]|uniref:hypothetical protein n=1 Tax=Noviherbaspirillum malthae TaxID=1260987 RepID=UPI0018902D37|nr:hypothetical protein [Noviherbaspirillum malthae]
MEAKPKQMERRRFVGACLSTAAISAIPGGIALAQTTVRQRLEWQSFRATTQYNSLLTAISSMKANTNASDRGSWQFWANAHVNYCPHGIAQQVCAMWTCQAVSRVILSVFLPVKSTCNRFCFPTTLIK